MNHNFKNLIIWKLGMDITRMIYQVSKQFPSDEKYGLTNQMRRCAVSIPSNIAEGCGLGTNSQLMHYIDIALGSSCELETQLMLAHDFGYLEKASYDEIIKLLGEFQKRTRTFKSTLQPQVR